MKCENCGKNEANVRYTQIINGEKKQIYLCEECSEKLGIGHTHFNMPIDFASFLGDFFNDMNDSTFLPNLSTQEEIKCKKCGLLFDDFLNTGKFGCSDCYSEFEEMVDPILKNIQGANRHIGRIGNVIEGNNLVQNDTEEPKEESKLDELKRKLKEAIKDERYEDAAKLRDEIKELEK